VNKFASNSDRVGVDFGGKLLTPGTLLAWIHPARVFTLSDEQRSWGAASLHCRPPWPSGVCEAVTECV